MGGIYLANINKIERLIIIIIIINPCWYTESIKEQFIL